MAEAWPRRRRKTTPPWQPAPWLGVAAFRRARTRRRVTDAPSLPPHLHRQLQHDKVHHGIVLMTAGLTHAGFRQASLAIDRSAIFSFANNSHGRNKKQRDRVAAIGQVTANRR